MFGDEIKMEANNQQLNNDIPPQQPEAPEEASSIVELATGRLPKCFNEGCNETPPEEPEDVSSNIELSTCRLRTGLNEDCLLKVLEFLNIYDLIQMCKTDNYFKDLITKWIIGKKLLNLRGMAQSCKNEIFETFGESMRKFIIYESDFNHFLETVIKHCTPGRLTEVELNLKEPNVENVNTIQQSMPYFSNLHKLKLNVLRFQRYSSFDDFLTALSASASNLRYLQLFHVDVEGQWLKTNRMGNLSELRILKPCTISMPDLSIFLHSLPKLETFLYKGEQDITVIGTTLVKCCPNLKTFEDVHTSNPNRRFHLGGMNRYNFLASFSNLHSVALTSYTFCGCDLYYPLTKLATKNIVKLRIFSNLEYAVTFNDADRERIMKYSFDYFKTLLFLELDVRNFRLAGDMRCEFIMHLATQLKNLESFTLQSSRLNNANKIIESLPQIRTLSISQITFKHLPVEMRKIVRTLRAIRQVKDTDDESNILQLIVNIEQWRELQVYKDINKLAETIIDPYVEPYNHFRRCPSEIDS